LGDGQRRRQLQVDLGGDALEPDDLVELADDAVDVEVAGVGANPVADVARVGAVGLEAPGLRACAGRETELVEGDGRPDRGRSPGVGVLL
jgi:hypothetical protein